MTTRQHPIHRPGTAPDAAATPRRSAPSAARIRLASGYYDPDSAAFDDVRRADFDNMVKSTTRVQPAPALARSGV